MNYNEEDKVMADLCSEPYKESEEVTEGYLFQKLDDINSHFVDHKEL